MDSNMDQPWVSTCPRLFMGMPHRSHASVSRPRKEFKSGRSFRQNLGCTWTVSKYVRMPPVKISIAMCTYNGAGFLPAQWDSILSQSRRPDEIVVCDDGSSDQTRSLLERLAQESSIPVTLRFN